jgi:hypothetical protein
MALLDELIALVVGTLLVAVALLVTIALLATIACEQDLNPKP